jgi:hypothetical protein
MKRNLIALTLLLAACSARAADVATGVIDPYLRIQTALSTDTLKDIAADAGLIATEAERLGEQGKALHASAKELQGAADIKAARAAFGKLSEALLGYAAATSSGLGNGVRIAYCPMVQKSWAQKGDTIANPYYGKSMLTCGDFKKS